MKTLVIFLLIMLSSCFTYRPVLVQSEAQRYTAKDFLLDKVYKVKLKEFEKPLIIQIKNVTDSTLVIVALENKVLRNNSAVYLTSIEEAQHRKFSFAKSALFYCVASIPLGLLMFNAAFMF